jgi:hypothetical protein
MELYQTDPEVLIHITALHNFVVILCAASHTQLVLTLVCCVSKPALVCNIWLCTFLDALDAEAGLCNPLLKKASHTQRVVERGAAAWLSQHTHHMMLGGGGGKTTVALYGGLDAGAGGGGAARPRSFRAPWYSTPSTARSPAYMHG